MKKGIKSRKYLVFWWNIKSLVWLEFHLVGRMKLKKKGKKKFEAGDGGP